MAVGAHCGVMVWNGKPSMVESRPRPTRRGVTGLAGGGETRCYVIWIRGSLVVNFVT